MGWRKTSRDADDIYELAENAELAARASDALVPAGGNDQPWAPSFGR